MINVEQNFIKKSKVNYIKCKVGQLHEGQVMNFICIDTNCKNKGLICPVCQTALHEGHQVMHLKIFLSEIEKNLSNDKSNEVASIGDYLKKLQGSRKQMLQVLKDTVNQIANKVKIVQQKIQQVYTSVRKTVLMQSTLGNKLPHLYHILTSNNDNQQSKIRQEISKCSELLQYKNNKVHIVDSCQNLITQFTNLPSIMSAHLSTVIPSITKMFDSLPIKIKKFVVEEIPDGEKPSFQLSKTKKSSTLIVSENLKQIEVKAQQMGGIAFIENKLDEENISKIAIKIKQNISDSILLGLGIPDLLKNKNYMFDESENNGLFGIFSMGIVLNNFDSPSFVFSTGDIIQIAWDPIEMKITFSRRNGIEKYEMFPPINMDEIKKMSFFISLITPGDKVQIVQ